MMMTVVSTECRHALVSFCFLGRKENNYPAKSNVGGHMSSSLGTPNLYSNPRRLRQ